MRRKRAALVAFMLALLAPGGLRAAAAEPDRRMFALVIGYNGRPPATVDDSLPPLRYADDDALAFYQLQRELGAEAVLLTVADPDTRRRYPYVADGARLPTTHEIARAIDRLNASMDAAARAGAKPVFVFFYSGHGTRDGKGGAALSLFDGTLSQAAMQEQVLDRIRAPLIHLFVDACHAEAVVRPRDVEAKTVDVRPEDLLEHLSKTSAARRPHVGLVVASSRSAATHEWDVYQSGVFTHEVISGLRGVADANHDGRVEYGELSAFLSAANREVTDPRARVVSIIQAPASSPREALSRLGPRATLGWLTGIPSAAGRFFIEDKRGNRILDGHAEPGFSISVAVPPDELLFLRNRDDESELIVNGGGQAKFETLAFAPRPMRARGAMDRSLREGLFLMPFGPAYYSGYVDQLEARAGSPAVGALTATPPSRTLVWTLRGSSAALLAASALFGVLAWDAKNDYDRTPFPVQAVEASDRFYFDTTMAITFAISGVVCATAAILVGRRQ
jgi:hypothetical protein